MKQILNQIGGAPCAGIAWFDKRNPANGRMFARVAEAGPAEVDRAVAAARASLAGSWGRSSTGERADLLIAIADGIERRFAEFLDAEVEDTGKPRSQASQVDIPRSIANFRNFAEAIRQHSTEYFEGGTPDGRGAIHLTQRRPIGVVAVLAPWNLPLLLLSWKVAPALACGNAVVCKPSEETPQTATLLAGVMRDAGVPDGVYNVVHGYGAGSAGELLCRHPDVDAITLTGESRTGTAVMKAAAEGTRAVSFELGGKNPSLVFADCDFDAALEGTVRSVFQNSGQICVGTERVYVERPIYARFVAALGKAAQSLKLGSPDDPRTAMGPLISEKHRRKVLAYYARARAEGATVIAGGGIPADMPTDLAEGAWVQPTIWTGLTEDSPVVREEIFGPCCHIAPFDNEDEVIARANDTEFGLAAALWTTNLSRAHRVATRLDAGIVWVNTWGHRDLRTPFGGTRRSGIGREGGRHSLDFYSELKDVCIKL